MQHVSHQQSQRSVRRNLGQWAFTGDMTDHCRLDGSCAWCGKAELRLTFEVRCATAERSCHICQVCLGQAPLRLEQESRAFEIEEWRHYLSELAIRLMHRTCRDVMRSLLASTDEPALQEVAVYFDRNVQLSPGRAATLLLVLSKSQMDVDPRIFDVQIRSAAHKQEFAALGEREKLAVWPAFSTTVQNRLISLGFAPSSSTPAIDHHSQTKARYAIAARDRAA